MLSGNQCGFANGALADTGCSWDMDNGVCADFRVVT